MKRIIKILFPKVYREIQGDAMDEFFKKELDIQKGKHSRYGIPIYEDEEGVVYEIKVGFIKC